MSARGSGLPACVQDELKEGTVGQRGPGVCSLENMRVAGASSRWGRARVCSSSPSLPGHFLNRWDVEQGQLGEDGRGPRTLDWPVSLSEAGYSNSWP